MTTNHNRLDLSTDRLTSSLSGSDGGVAMLSSDTNGASISGHSLRDTDLETGNES